MEETKQKPKEQISIMAFISYIGIFCLVPILTKEKDEFVFFHAKQGLILFICEVATWMILAVLPFFFFMISLVWFVWLVLSLIGMINVTKNLKQELPMIGQFADKFKF